MSLLEMLRPDTTRGWELLDDQAQHTLLGLARRAGDIATVRTLAERDGLRGPARQELLAEREPSIRRRILSRGDLTTAELTTILAGERRAGVLDAIAETAAGDTLDQLVTVALASKGASLAEALLAKSRVDDGRRRALIRHLITRGRSFSQLTTAATNRVVNAADTADILVWVAQSATYTHGWDVTRAVGVATSACTTAEEALTLLDALADAGLWAVYLRATGNLLDANRMLTGRGGLPASETTTVARTLSSRLDGHLPALTGRLRIELTNQLDAITPLLPDPHHPARSGGPDTEAPVAPSGPVDQLSAADIAHLITAAGDSLTALDTPTLTLLACNPNHTEQTASRVANALLSRDDCGTELFDRFDRIADPIWREFSRRSFTPTNSARAVLDRIGHDRLVAALTSPRFGAGPAQRTVWRSSKPLIGHPSTIAWVLESARSDPNGAGPLEQVALDLPATETAGAEAAVFDLLHRHLGTDEQLWDTVNRLAGAWEGTVRELIDTARCV